MITCHISIGEKIGWPMFKMAYLKNSNFDFAENLTWPVCYGTQQVCIVSKVFLDHFSRSNHLETIGGQTDGQSEKQLFKGHHIKSCYFWWQKKETLLLIGADKILIDWYWKTT